MQTMKKVLKAIANNRAKEEEKQVIRKGYWLVREYDKERFYISEYVSVLALEEVAEKMLSDKTGYGYWIDYCFGLDVKGYVQWSNMDLTDKFF